MRIVIIGEFSSFSKNLSEGFRSLGHDCFVFSWGDGFKNISQESKHSYTTRIKFNSRGKIIFFFSILISFLEYLKLRRYVKRMSKVAKFEAALVVNPCFVKKEKLLCFWHALFTKEMIRDLLVDPRNIFMSACGNDVPFYDYWRNRRWKNYRWIESGIKQNYSPSEIRHFMNCMTLTQKVIPVMYMYAEAWRNSLYTSNCMVLPTIPLPVDTTKFESNNVLGSKIVIFHGIIRPIEKGTSFIVKAMDMLQEKYPNRVECIAKGGMPLADYLLLLNRTNILIDQACCDSVGMNGLYALAMGKVVLGGNTIENQKEFGEYDCPIVDIMPDSEQIFHELEKLVLDRDKIIELSKKSREYVMRVHDSKVIAQKYIQIFRKAGDYSYNDCV